LNSLSPHFLFISVYSYFTTNQNNLCFGLTQLQGRDAKEVTVQKCKSPNQNLLWLGFAYQPQARDSQDAKLQARDAPEARDAEVKIITRLFTASK